MRNCSAIRCVEPCAAISPQPTASTSATLSPRSMVAVGDAGAGGDNGYKVVDDMPVRQRAALMATVAADAGLVCQSAPIAL